MTRGEITTPATEKDGGVKTYTCSVCGYKKTEKIAHKHTYSDKWSGDDTYHWHTATCEHTSEVKDKAEHTFDDGEITTPATSKDGGVKTYTCSICKYEKTVKIAHQHTYGKWENASDLKSNTRECSTCHERETRDGIVVTPDNAQTLIDSVNSGKIYFSAGEYGDLSFGQGKLVSYARRDGNYPVVNVNEDLSEGVYHYYRFIRDMELIAESGAVMKGSIFCKTAHIHENSPVDPITGTERQYYTHVFVDGLTIDGFIFNEGQIFFSVYGAPATVKNVTIRNCKFVGNENIQTKKIQAMAFSCDQENYFGNIVIEDNTVTDYYQGVHGQCVNNITITGCNISGTTHNAIAIQSSTGKFSGKILLDGNTISNTSDRAIRFNDGHDATIIVSNNTFTNAIDAESQLLKSGTLTNCTYSFSGNTYNGKKIANKSGSDSSWVLTISKE